MKVVAMGCFAWGRIAATLIGLVVLGSCGRFAFQTELEVSQSVAVDGVARVEIDILDGDVTLQGIDTGDLVVEGRCLLASDTESQSEKLGVVVPEFSVERDGSTLRLVGPRYPENVDETLNIIALNVVVRLPRTLHVSVQARERGRFGATGIVGDIAFTNREGDFRLVGCSGVCELRSQRSKVLIDRQAGPVVARLNQGDIHVFAARFVEPGYDLETKSGNLHCIIPADSAVSIDAETELGRATNGFGIAVEELAHGAKRMAGGEGPMIRLRTEAGGISVGTRRD